MSSKTADVIAAALCERIENGEFVTRRLPAERALSEQYSTTRITLREARSAGSAGRHLPRTTARLVHCAAASHL